MKPNRSSKPGRMVAGVLLACAALSCSDDETAPAQPAIAAAGAAAPGAPAAPAAPRMSFFVTSQKNMTGNLGGLVGADMRCQTLATAVAAGDQVWHAYLSVEADPANGGMPTHARDRIGAGPWFNQKLMMIAANVAELHTMNGSLEAFLDEKGAQVPGVGALAMSMLVEHDVLTGTTPEGMVAAGMTCADWTSESPMQAAMVGHSDGLGLTGPTSWHSVHPNESCANTLPRGGAGRIYCFATGATR